MYFSFLQILSSKNLTPYFSRMLGYSYGQPTVESQFGSVSSTFKMDEVQCTGSEASLLDCPHNTVDDCGTGEGAGVICSNSGRLKAFWAKASAVIIYIFCVKCQKHNSWTCQKSVKCCHTSKNINLMPIPYIAASSSISKISAFVIVWFYDCSKIIW